MNGIHPLSEWEEIAGEFARRKGTLFLLGGTDAGKSTFFQWLANRFLLEKKRIALLDADIGQSHLGPPGAMGIALPDRTFSSFSDLRLSGLAFVGTTSPMGNFLPCLAGLQSLAALAFEKNIPYLVVNTTGFVKGRHAEALKLAKIEILRPSVVVVFERNWELSPYISWLKRIESIHLFRIRCSPLARTRGLRERIEFRKMRWREWFARGVRVVVPEDRVFHFGLSRKKWDGKMAALGDFRSACQSIGRVLETGSRSIKVEVYPRPRADFGFLFIGGGEAEV